MLLLLPNTMHLASLTALLDHKRLRCCRNKVKKAGQPRATILGELTFVTAGERATRSNSTNKAASSTN